MSQNWKSYSYVKSMGKWTFRVKNGKRFVQVWSENIFPILDINVFQIWPTFAEIIVNFGIKNWKRHSYVKSMGNWESSQSKI